MGQDDVASCSDHGHPCYSVEEGEVGVDDHVQILDDNSVLLGKPFEACSVDVGEPWVGHGELTRNFIVIITEASTSSSIKAFRHLNLGNHT